MGIVNFFKEANEAVRKGNEYRLAKYGPALTFKESCEKSREQHKHYKENHIPKCLSMFASNSVLEKQEKYKMGFEFWEEWTGGRFERRKNPYTLMPDAELRRKGIKTPLKIESGTVCRSNPVTGFWEKL